MKVCSLCVVLLLSYYWQFNSHAVASFLDIEVSGGSDPQTLLQREVSDFALRLDEVTLREHDRFHRSLDGLPRNRLKPDGRHGDRVKRNGATDFRHGFHPGTGVGNREDFTIASVELIADTAVANGSAREWGHLTMGANGTVVTALTEEALLVYRLRLDDPAGPLSLKERFPNVISFEAYDRFSWQAGHIVKTNHYLTIYDATRFLSHYKVSKENITLQDSVDLGSLSVVDIEYFAIDTVTFLGALTGNGFLRLYRWSSRYCRFYVAEDLTVPVSASNMQTFDISGRHYILVTATETRSTLFKYHSRQNSFTQYQLLYPDGAKQALYFTDAYEHFLVFIDALGLTSTFFRWNGVEFTPLQVLDTVAANHWDAAAVPGVQDGSLLILSSDSSEPGRKPLALYKHDPATDSFQTVGEAAIVEALNPPGYVNATSTLSFREGPDVYLLVGVSKRPSAQEPGNLFRMTFDTVASTNPVVAESRQLEATIADLEDEVGRLEASLDQASLTVSASVTKDGNEAIRGDKWFLEVDAEEIEVNHIVVKGKTLSELLGYGLNLHTSLWEGAAAATIDSNAYIYPPIPTGSESLSHLVNQSRIQREQILGLQVLMSDAVYLNCSQTITGAKNIRNMTIEGTLKSFNFSTTYFDGVDIDELNRQAFRLDAPNQVINGGLTFSQDLTSTESIRLDDWDLVNGVDLSETAVLIHGAQSIEGRKVFQQDTVIQSDMVLDPGVLLNGIDPSEQLVTLNGSHLITGRLTFMDVLHVRGNVVTPATVDGVDPGTLCIDVLTKSGNQTVTGPLVFAQAPVFETDLQYGGLLMGVNISGLNALTVRINQDTNITGWKDFLTDIDVLGDVDVEGTVSNMDLSLDVVQLTASGSISGARTFSGGVTVSGALTLDGKVNGLDLSQDVVTLSGDHRIEGKINFTKGIGAAEIGEVTGTVDTVDLSAWAGDIMTLSTAQTVDGPIVFLDDAVIQANLTVSGLINGIDLVEMYGDTFFKTSDQVQTISGSKNFTRPLTVTSGRLVLDGLINGYNMTQDFLNKYSDQSVTGQKDFLHGFAADAGLDVSGLIAGVDLEELYRNSLLRGRQAHLRGQRTFLGNVRVDGVVGITGNVDGVDLSTNVLTTNGNQTVTGLKSFGRLDVSSMSSTHMNAALSVNGRNLTEFVLGRVDLESSQAISANHTIAATVTANNVDVVWMVNTVNLTALLNDVMSKTSVQTITGSKTVAGAFVVHGNVSLGDHINDVQLREFAARALLLEGPPQVITGRKTLKDLVILSEHLQLTGLLDGVDLDFFMSDIIFPDNLPKIPATKTFVDGFNVTGNITVSGTVDGVDLSEEVMTTNTDQNISGSYTVVDDILSTAVDTTVSGLVNGVDLVYLNISILKTTGDQTVDSPLVFAQNLTSTTDIVVTGLVDGSDLSELKFRCAILDQPFNLTGNLTFEQGVTFEGPLNVTGLVNGRNLSVWYQDVVLLHTDEVVLGNKTFHDDVAVSGVLSVPGDMQANVVFGRNFDTFVADAVTLTGNVTITGTKTFLVNTDALADVYVQSTIDGVYIEDIVTLDGDELISGLTTFSQSIAVNGHINITGLVNDVNVSDIYRSTFRLDSPQVVTATKEFARDVTVMKDVIIGGLVDGIDLDLQAVTLDTDQTLDGAIVFSAPPTVDGNMSVTGYVGGVNLTHLVTDRATLSGDETVRGLLNFHGHVTFLADVLVADLFDGVSLPHLWDLQTEMLLWAWLDIDGLMLLSADQCEELEELQWTYANTVENFAYILEIQEINFRVRSFEAFMLDGVRHLALAVHSNRMGELCVDSYVYAWNATSYQFVEKAVIATNGASSWHAFERRRTQYLAVANEGMNTCDGDGIVTNTIYAYNGSRLVEHQQLPSDETRAMDTTDIHGVLHLALANTKTTAPSYVYRQGLDGQFYPLQNFTFGGATDVKFVHNRNITLLVFASVSPSQSPIYLYNAETDQFDFHQYVSTSYATAVDTYRYRGNMGVAFANHAKLYANNKITYTVPIEVFFWSESTSLFELFEMVEFTGAVDVDMFHIGADLYLAAVSEYEELQIFKYEGVVGFSLVLTLASYGAVSVEVFDIPDLPTIENLFFALAIDPYTEEEVSTRILREKVIGQGVRLRDLHCDVLIRDLFHGDPRLLDGPISQEFLEEPPLLPPISLKCSKSC